MDTCKKKVFFFTLYDTEGASSRYRIYIFRELLDRNFYTHYSCFWSNTYIKKYMGNTKKYFIQVSIIYLLSVIKRIFLIFFLAPHYDVVLFQKSVFPKTPFNLIWYLRLWNIKVIFDVDDAIYLNPKDYSRKIAKKSHCIFVGNQTLKEYYMRFNNHIIIIPTTDNTHKYEKYHNDTFKHKQIGWIGSKTTIENLDLIIEPMNRFIQDYPQVKFIFICDESYGYDKKIKNAQFIKWDVETYIHDLKDISIGIMPLKNTEFNNGKCGFKLIQYLSLLKPVIASDVGVNSEIVSNGGIVCKKSEDWYQAFKKLLFHKEYYTNCVNYIKSDFMSNYHFIKIGNTIVEEIKNI